MLALDGKIEVECAGLEVDPSRRSSPTVLHAGQSVFVPHAAGTLGVRGGGRIVVAYVP